MNAKDLVRRSLNHQSTDRIPVDFGSTHVTGMHVSCIEKLREYYGLEKRLIKVCEPYQMLGEIDDDLKEVLGIHTDCIPAPKTIFGFRNENWKEFRTLWNQDVLVSEHFNTTTDTNGDILIYPEGDMTARPSGRMPTAGYFFDTIVRQEPIDEDNLNPEDNLEEFGPISDEDLEYYKQQAEALSTSQRAIVGGAPGTPIGDIALVPAPFLKNPKGIRDIEEWYVSTAIRMDYLHEVFSRQCDIAIENLKKIHGVVGETFDAIILCGTDFGTQRSTFCSPETFDELYAPYYKRMTNWIHENTTWKIFKHSCGAVETLMEHFIDSGFDIINPVQCSAAGMDPQHLKDRYGDRLVFWGGGVDTQKTMPFETPEDVRAEVMKRCEIFSKNGGFVFNTIHNLQARSPVENMVAMFDAVKEFNGIGCA